MVADRIKAMIRALAGFCFKLMPVDLFFRIAQRGPYLLARLTFFRDWVVMIKGRPQYFDHQINLYQWRYEPKRWSFTARGVYAREKMFRGCKVLDLCCGDGSYSYLFFSDIAGSIDAVDADQTAVDHAVKHYSFPNIRYHELDVIEDDFPASGYDFVIWNAAICYFELEAIHRILGKIVNAGNASLRLCGIAPLASGYVDHKTEFHDADELRALLQRYFTTVQIKQIDEITASNIYFQATGPRKANRAFSSIREMSDGRPDT